MQLDLKGNMKNCRNWKGAMSKSLWISRISDGKEFAAKNRFTQNII